MEKIDKKTIKALATESRVNILRALAQRRKMPSELSKELGLAASTIIGHLGILESAELVERKDTGRKWIYYELTRKGKNLIKPIIPVEFVVVLSLGLILMLFGSMNLTYDYTQSYEYPVITIEKTVVEGLIPVSTTSGVGDATATPGVLKEPEENISANVSNITNETKIINYEIGYTQVQGINWTALIILIVGTAVAIVGGTKVIKKS
jgi:DNA-binding transcriptional ArsR family regulator